MRNLLADHLTGHPIVTTLQLTGMGLAVVALIAILMPIIFMSLGLWLTSIRSYPAVNLVAALAISGSVYGAVSLRKLHHH